MSLLQTSNPLLTNVPNTSLECYKEGTQLSVVKKQDEAVMRAVLLRAVMEVCKIIDAKKTITEALEFEMLIDEVVKEFWFMKLEEILLVFKRMTLKGGWYERLKAGDFMDELREYDRNERDTLSVDLNKGANNDFLKHTDTNTREAVLNALKTPKNESVKNEKKVVQVTEKEYVAAKLREEMMKDAQKVANDQMSEEDFETKWDYKLKLRE